MIKSLFKKTAEKEKELKAKIADLTVRETAMETTITAKDTEIAAAPSAAYPEIKQSHEMARDKLVTTLIKIVKERNKLELKLHEHY